MTELLKPHGKKSGIYHLDDNVFPWQTEIGFTPVQASSLSVPFFPTFCPPSLGLALATFSRDWRHTTRGSFEMLLDV